MPVELETEIVNGKIIRKSGTKWNINLAQMAQRSLLPTPTCMDASKNGDMTGAAKMLLGATIRNSGQQIQKTLTDAIQMNILKENLALARELASKELMKRTKLPGQQEFVEWIKTLGTSKELVEKLNLKATKIEHWFRMDQMGFSYPSIEDWEIIKMHYPVPMEMDYKMTYQESIEWKGKMISKEILETPLKHKIQHNSKTSQLNPRFVAEMMGFPPTWTELPFLNGDKKA